MNNRFEMRSTTLNKLETETCKLSLHACTWVLDRAARSVFK